jgi:hypothetical protein
MKRVVTGFVLSSIASLCLAEAVSVGRAEVKLPGDNWQSFPVAGEVTQYGGDRSGQVNSERKLFIKKSVSNAVQAIVMVSGSTRMSSPGKLVYAPNCPSDKYWYRKGNEGFRQPFVECWGVLKGEPIALENLQGLVPEIADLFSKENLQMAHGAYTMTSTYRNENGTFLTVKMFVASDFSLPTPGTAETVPEGVEGKVMQYGTQLAGAVRASVMSWSGVLTVPNFSFTQP